MSPDSTASTGQAGQRPMAWQTVSQSCPNIPDRWRYIDLVIRSTKISILQLPVDVL